jgi:4-amino-4-deoxy-L-arabinose transferase-like glycosyltransferase
VNRLPPILFAVALAAVAAVLAARLPGPFNRHVDYNGAVWSQAAKQFLRDGVGATAGVPAPFYFGPPPVPREALYTHHPPLLPLVVTGAFAALGEREWVARLVPVLGALAGLVLLWALVRAMAGGAAGAMAGVVAAGMPMQIHFGSMVNFEPLAGALLVGMLLCAWQHEATGRPIYRTCAAGLLAVALGLTWFAHLYAAVLAVWCWGRGRRREGWMIFGLAIGSVLLFLAQIGLASPGAWRDLAETFHWRTGAGQEAFAWGRWGAKMGEHLGAFLPWPYWVLAAAGAWLAWRERGDRRVRWLGLAALGLFVTNLVYVVAFRNASAIHGYAGYYFIFPLAAAGGLALGRWFCGGTVARAGAVAVAVALGFAGHRSAAREDVRLPLLGDAGEPGALIPELGAAIRERFAPGTVVLLNFPAEYSPHLPYYAGRQMVNGLVDAAHWLPVLADPARAAGGVIAESAGGAERLLAELPPGRRETFEVRGRRFVAWHPGPAAR